MSATATHQQVTDSILSRLDIAAAYQSMGVELVNDSPNESGWITCWAAGRPHGETASAGINVRTGRYHDFGGLCENLSLFDFAALYASQRFVDWKSARDHFAASTGVAIPRGRPATRPDEHLDFMPWNDESLSILRLWCAFNKPGIIPEAVLAAGGRLARYRKQYTVICLPIWGHQLLDADPVGWVMWNSQLGENSTLPIFHKDKSVTWAKMKTTAGSKPGLIGVHGLQNIVKAETVVKSEGPGDMLALMGVMPDIRQSRAVVVTNANGAGEIPPRWVIDLFAGKRVLTVHDADEPGQIGAVKWSEAIARTAQDSRNVQLPYPIEKKHGKDLRDWIRSDNGSWESLLRLSNDVPQVSPPAPGAPKSDDDPMRLARVYLEKYQRLEGTDLNTIAHWRDDWYRWTGTYWQRATTSEIQSRLYACVEHELDGIAIEREKTAVEGAPVKAIRATQKLIADVLAGLRSLVIIPDRTEPNSYRSESGHWIKQEWMSVENGILKLSDLLAADLINGDSDTMEFVIPHSPLWFSVNCLPYRYDPDAVSEFWTSLISMNLEGDAERIGILQEWTGYMLTPDTRYQKFLLLEGEGANGKSVYCGVLKALLGSSNVSHVPLEMFGEHFQLTSTLGRLANIATECGELDKVAEGALKAFVGGDSMQFDRKFKESIEATPTARLILATNNRPRFVDRSDGIWRRLIYIPFRYQIPEAERIPGLDRADQWTTVWADQMPGILNWAIEGLRRLRRNERFSKSALCERSIAEYRAESNPTAEFLTDYVKEDVSATISSNKLYEVYRMWCTETGHRPLSNNIFGKEVRKTYRGIDYTQFNDEGIRRRCYNGIKLREDPSGF